MARICGCCFMMELSRAPLGGTVRGPMTKAAVREMRGKRVNAWRPASCLSMSSRIRRPRRVTYVVRRKRGVISSWWREIELICILRTTSLWDRHECIIISAGESAVGVLDQFWLACCAGSVQNQTALVLEFFKRSIPVEWRGLGLEKLGQCWHRQRLHEGVELLKTFCCRAHDVRIEKAIDVCFLQKAQILDGGVLRRDEHCLSHESVSDTISRENRHIHSTRTS